MRPPPLSCAAVTRACQLWVRCCWLVGSANTALVVREVGLRVEGASEVVAEDSRDLSMGLVLCAGALDMVSFGAPGTCSTAIFQPLGCLGYRCRSCNSHRSGGGRTCSLLRGQEERSDRNHPLGDGCLRRTPLLARTISPHDDPSRKAAKRYKHRHQKLNAKEKLASRSGSGWMGGVGWRRAKGRRRKRRRVPNERALRPNRHVFRRLARV